MQTILSGEDNSTEASQSTENKNSITFIGVGDIMMGTTFPKHRRLLPPNNGAKLFSEVEPFFKEADLVFGNLEGVLANGGRCVKNVKSKNVWAFRTPTRIGVNLKNASFDIMSISNNHSFDFGHKGLKSTKDTLKKHDIKYVGPRNYYPEFEINDIKVGFIAFSTNSRGYNLINLKKSKKVISKLSKQFDILIVSFHGGTEGTKALRTQNKMEYLGREPRGNVVKFAKTAIDNGADLIIGHGPHVPRGIELYKDKLIAYSLGNFCTYGSVSLRGVRGLAPILKVKMDQDGNFINGQIISCKQLRPGYPVLDSKNKAAKLIKRLSEKDFKKSKLKITEDGQITKS